MTQPIIWKLFISSKLWNLMFTLMEFYLSFSKVKILMSHTNVHQRVTSAEEVLTVNGEVKFN